MIKKVILTIIKIALALYVLLCIGLYFFQEKLIFFPDKLKSDYKFSFDQPFEEFNIPTKTGEKVNGLLFTTQDPKGLIFYLHGNAGALDTWGRVARQYTDLHYEVFMMDYPGYGKSEGSIKSEAQIIDAVQAAYREMTKRYEEREIVVMGFSIGTGPAAQLASTNHPRMLILQAPYYNLTDMMRHEYPVLPTFILKYKFPNNKYLRKCKMPVAIYHGDQDEVIYYGSSEKLKAEMKPGDILIPLKGQGHNGISENLEYMQSVIEVLH